MIDAQNSNVILHQPDVVEGGRGEGYYHSCCSCGWKSEGQFEATVAMAYAIRGHAAMFHKLAEGETRSTA